MPVKSFLKEGVFITIITQVVAPGGSHLSGPGELHPVKNG